MWGATGVSIGKFARHKRFNSRTHVGCDQSMDIAKYQYEKFQFTHPCGVRPCAFAINAKTQLSFNSRTHVGCDRGTLTAQNCWTEVSIHAPMWGATIAAEDADPSDYDVSIHAPMWGATRSARRSLGRSSRFNSRTHVGCDLISTTIQLSYTSFNSRTHVGCDRFSTSYGTDTRIVSIHAPMWGATLYLWQAPRTPQVSIHAPMWGATQAFFFALSVTLGFNSRTHVGCDAVFASSLSWYSPFQFTHPCGVRPYH